MQSFVNDRAGVPYAALERARREARERFPHVRTVRPILANGAPAVEIFTAPGTAFVWVPGWAL